MLINGDAMGLGKALKGIDSQCSKTQSNLRAVNKALKLDPSNVELVHEKQEILASSIAATKDKLKQLESVQKQVKEQYQNGSIDQGQYIAFQQELAATKSKLKQLTSEQKEYNQEVRSSKGAAAIFGAIGEACEKAGKKLQEMGGKVKDIGTKMTTHVTAPIVGVGTAAVAAWNAVDDGADAMIKATGATGEAAEALEQTYKNIAADFPADFEVVGSTLGEVNTRFGYTGTQAEECAKSFLKFSEITGTDAVTAVQLVSRAMGDAGIPAEEYSGIMDQLAVAAQASGISMDTLTTNLAKYGAPMRALGFDTASSIAIFSQWEKCGVNTEIAFSGMKKAISNWSKEGQDARVEFRKTLDEIAAAPDIASATTKAIEVFGAKAGPDLADAIQGGRFEFSEFLSLIEGSEGAVENTYGALEDGGTEAAKTINNLKIAGAELGNTLQQMAVPVLKKVTEIVQKATAKFNGLSDSQKETIVKVGLIVAAVGPALVILGSLISGVGKVISVVGMLGKALSLLAANPVGLIIAAITAMVAAFVYAYKHSEKFRDIVNKSVTKVKDVCTKAFKWISDKLSAAWKVIGPIFNKMGEVTKKVMGAMHDTVKEKMSNIKNAYQEAGGGIKGIVAGTFEAVKGSWTAGLTFVDKLTGGKLTEIKNKFMQNHPELVAIAEKGMSALKATVQEKLTNIKNAYSEAGGGIKGVVAAAGEGIKGSWTAGLTFIDHMTGGKLTAIKNSISSNLQSAKGIVSSVMESIRSAFSNKLEAARTAVYNAIRKIRELFDFSWSLPHLKMPHFSISGSFSLRPPRVPHLSVSWYKNGGILSGAQLFGTMGSKLLGGGEAGPEAVLPLSDFYGELRSILGSFMQMPSTTALHVNIEHFENRSDRDLDDLVDYIDDRLTDKYNSRRTAFV